MKTKDRTSFPPAKLVLIGLLPLLALCGCNRDQSTGTTGSVPNGSGRHAPGPLAAVGRSKPTEAKNDSEVINMSAELMKRLPVTFLETTGTISLDSELGLSNAEVKAVSTNASEVWKAATALQAESVGGEVEMSIDTQIHVSAIPREQFDAAFQKFGDNLPLTIAEDTRSLMMALFRRQCEHEFGRNIRISLSVPKDLSSTGIMNGEPLPNPALRGRRLVAQYDGDAEHIIHWDSSRFPFIRISDELR
jgi:hypothetical protein